MGSPMAKKSKSLPSAHHPHQGTPARPGLGAAPPMLGHPWCGVAGASRSTMTSAPGLGEQVAGHYCRAYRSSVLVVRFSKIEGIGTRGMSALRLIDTGVNPFTLAEAPD